VWIGALVEPPIREALMLDKPAKISSTAGGATRCCL
jgi:hypothetical protein